MRIFTGLLISTLAAGTVLATGCAEHRYQNGPYAGYGGYSGYYGYNDPYYRQWLAERQYNYIEYNRLDRARQQEYWNWRRQNEARFRNDPRFRENQRFAPNGRFANDHVRNDRVNNNYARTRNADRDRHQADKDRHQAQKRDKDRDKDKDRDHDRDRR